MLQKRLNTVNLKDFTLKEILDFLLTENKLNYEYKNGILKIGYYVTKTFKVDYIGTVRSVKGTGSLQIGDNQSQSASATISGFSGNGQTSVNINTKDEFDFWKQIREDLIAIINPHDISYQYENNRERNKETTANKDTLNEEQTTKETASIKRNDLIINPQAGLVTVTKDAQTVKKVEEYLSTVMDRIHKQVLIDVQLLSVSLSSSKTTGIDWSQIYNLQNLNLNFGSGAMRGVDTWKPMRAYRPKYRPLPR